MKRKRVRVIAATQSAARRAYEAWLNYYAARIRRSLKDREHRTPSDRKVTAVLRARLAADGMEKFASEFLDLMRRFESVMRRRSREWTAAERQNAFDTAALYFQECAAFVDRPRGRPRRKSSGRGIVNSAMAFDSPQHRQQKRGEMENLVDRMLKYERGMKLGAAANRKYPELVRAFGQDEADKMTDTPDGYLQYLERERDPDDHDDNPEQEAMRRRLPPGAIRLLLEEFGIEAPRTGAFKMRLSRARRKRPV